MSLDKFASADGKPPQQPAFSAAPEESDEDLFNFDELTAALAKPAPAAVELDSALHKVEQAKQEVAQVIAPTPAATTPTPAQAPVQAPTHSAAPAAAKAPRPVPVVADDFAPAGGAPSVVMVPQRLSMSPVAAALLGGVVLANVALMAFAWRSVSATRDMVLDVANDVREASADLRSESQQRTTLAVRESEPTFGALPEGFRTLDAARELIAQGEHARARRMLHGLLAVIDRIEQPARDEIEARASFLVADSYRLEGDALAKAAEERR